MSTVLEEIRAAAEAAAKGGNSAEAFTFAQWASYIEQLERDRTEARSDAERVTKRLQRLQDEILGAFGRWSVRLGWGIAGNQPECCAMMDRSVSELLKLREGVELLKRCMRCSGADIKARHSHLFTRIIAFLVNHGVPLGEIVAESREEVPVPRA